MIAASLPPTDRLAAAVCLVAFFAFLSVMVAVEEYVAGRREKRAHDAWKARGRT